MKLNKELTIEKLYKLNHKLIEELKALKKKYSITKQVHKYIILQEYLKKKHIKNDLYQMIGLFINKARWDGLIYNKNLKKVNEK